MASSDGLRSGNQGMRSDARMILRCSSRTCTGPCMSLTRVLGKRPPEAEQHRQSSAIMEAVGGGWLLQLDQGGDPMVRALIIHLAHEGVSWYWG